MIAWLSKNLVGLLLVTGAAVSAYVVAHSDLFQYLPLFGFLYGVVFELVVRKFNKDSVVYNLQTKKFQFPIIVLFSFLGFIAAFEFYTDGYNSVIQKKYIVIFLFCVVFVATLSHFNFPRKQVQA